MADNVNVTAGIGTVIATDQVGTDHYQKIKLSDGTADSSTIIAAGIGVSANAIRVVPANDITDATYIGDIKFGESLPAGSNAIGIVTPAGDIAHDAADSGNPVKVGGKAVNTDGTAPGTAVVEGDRANFITDLYGRQCVDPVHPNLWSASLNYAAAQTNAEVKAAPGAGLSLYITDIIISNGAVAGNVKLVEDTATPVDVLEDMYFAVTGGAVIPLKTPIKLTANKNLGITSVSCTTHSITVSGYIAP